MRNTASGSMVCYTMGLMEDDLVGNLCGTSHQPEEDLGGKALSAYSGKDLD